jgi:thioesterase domain-containing protein
VRKQGVAHEIGASPTPTFERIRDSAARALANYRPKFYPGEIKFVRADIPSEFPADPAAIWANLAAQLAIQTVEGNHESMLKTHFAGLGAVLSHYLQHLPSSE